jgi:probable addiction module antidote protein
MRTGEQIYLMLNAGDKSTQTKDVARAIEKTEETEVRAKVSPTAARKLGVRKFDAADYLRDEADIAAYLEAAAGEDDPRVLAAALGDVARARGMAELARQTGITREALYRSLSAKGNPELATLTKVLRAFGMRLAIQPAAR